MKRIFVLLVGLITLSFSIAQSSVWKAEKNGEIMYLAGTIHLIRPADLPLPSPFLKALESSDILYIETDVDSLQIPTVAQKMMKKMMLTDGKTLTTVLSEETYAQLEAECAKVSIPLAQLNAFKPSLAIISLTAMKLMQMGMSTEGVDKLLVKKAKELNKPVAFMETTDFQVGIIAAMGEGNEEEFTQYSLKDMHKMETEFTSLLEEWKIGASTKMNESIKEMKTDFPAIYESLLADRNAQWIKRILTLADNGKVEMIAVGSLHLHGETGLIEVLKTKGFNISQVK